MPMKLVLGHGNEKPDNIRNQALPKAHQFESFTALG
jgi:hypothetical protein